jgi:3-oxoadipate enol-lactonase
MAVRYVSVRGIRLCVEVTGNPAGPPLVLIHALGTDKSSWDAIAPAFAGTHYVYAADMRGFGDSDRPGQYSFQDMRDDVLGLLDAIGADRADIVGHSMGATVAWLVAEAQPERVAHLVVEDTPPPRQGVRLPRTPPSEPPEEVPFDWQALLAVAAQVNDPDPVWWDQVPAVTAPVLMLAGGQDSHVPQHLFAEVLARLPNGRMLEIPVGHHIHEHAPDEFLTAVKPFLGSGPDDGPCL